MQVQGQSGNPPTTASLGVGTAAPLRQGNMGEAIVSELHGRYYEATYRKSTFAAATQAALASTAAFATTYTGLCLSNPIGSNVNLVLNKIGFASILAQTTALAFGIMTGFNASTNVTHTTPGAPSSNFVGGAAGVGLVDTAATLPVAPTLRQVLGVVDTGATTVATVDACEYDLEGDIIIPPGGFAAIYTSSASVAASLLASMAWEEVPV
jgi:hypothetical protein